MESASSTPLPKNTAEESPESRWLKSTYRPGEVNLSVRAVIIGMLIGGTLCLSNLYVFFKTGWIIGVTLTACILAFSFFQAARALRLVKRPLGVLAK